MKDYFHEFIDNLLDNYFTDNSECRVKFTKLLNDIRYGYVHEVVYKEHFDQLDGFTISTKLVTLMLAASKKQKATR